MCCDDNNERRWWLCRGMDSHWSRFWALEPVRLKNTDD
ncbi:unnamed protein product [Arabidopsis lyrata]|nr:unnamed protein product [Arabidopsis lyrata]